MRNAKPLFGGDVDIVKMSSTGNTADDSSSMAVTRL